MKIYCGIDFGTTNTVVSICGRDGSLIDSFSVPTIIFVPFENQGVSRIYIGEKAQRAYEEGRKGRYIHSIKRSLSDRYLRHTTINRTYVKLEKIICLFLIELKKIMYQKWCIEPRNIVLGRPVKFSLDADDDKMANGRLLESFKMAGFQSILQLEEPVAASLCFEEKFTAQDRSFLIMDLGGGTSDFSLMSRDPAKAGIDKYEVDAIDGINIGGDNFDENIMYDALSPVLGINSTFESFGKRLPMPVHIYKDVCRWNTMHLTDSRKTAEEFRDYLYGSDDPVAVHRLRAIVENKLSHQILERVRRCKHELSRKNQSEISFDQLGLGIRRPVTRDFLAASLKKPSDSIFDLLERVRGPERYWNDIDKIILTGGSSRLTCIEKRAGNLVEDHRLLMDSNFYNSVSKGLALYAYHNKVAIL